MSPRRAVPACKRVAYEQTSVRRNGAMLVVLRRINRRCLLASCVRREPVPTPATQAV
jgi:hypothetical protein